MEFTPDDFKRMMFNVYEADIDKPFVQQFPELALYDEFKENLPKLDRNRIIKYICYVYDKNSPYRVKYKDLTQRKVRAMIDCGYGLTDGNVFPPEIEDVIQGRDYKVADMAIAFIKLHCDLEYAHVLLLEAMYFKAMKNVFLGQNEKIKELNEIKESYTKAQADLVSNDQTKALMQSLYKSINRDRIKLSPEDIASSIKDKGIEATIAELDTDDQTDLEALDFPDDDEF